MISALCWVPKGVTKIVKEDAKEPSKDEIEDILKSGVLNRSGESEEEEDENMDVDTSEKADEVAHALAAAEALGNSQGNNSNLQDVVNGLENLLDGYDEEDDDPNVITKGRGDTYYLDNSMDPYLQNNDDDNDEDSDDDVTVKPTDGVLVCAFNEDEISRIQVLIFDDSEDGEPYMEVYHEIILSAFPLCTAWLDCKPKSGESADIGNFIAVGSFEPAIEIFDIDRVEVMEPIMVLGGVSKKKKKAKMTPMKYKKGSHKDSVLGLAWNKDFRNVLASASADKLVKIWNVAEGKCVTTAEHHTDKVQAVAWNSHSPQVLLSGSFDRSVVMMDCRSSTHASNRWCVAADVESLAWDPHNEHSFVVSLDNGTVEGFDIRAATSSSSSGSKPSFTLHAHDKAVTSVCYNPKAPNLLATASTDKMVKLWDLSNNQPSCVASRNTKSGAVFSISFSEDSAFSLAIGGSKGGPKIWDTLTDPGIVRTFGKYSNKKTADPMQTV